MRNATHFYIVKLGFTGVYIILATTVVSQSVRYFEGLQEFSPVRPADVVANKFEGNRINCQAPAAYPGI